MMHEYTIYQLNNKNILSMFINKTLWERKRNFTPKRK